MGIYQETEREVTFGVLAHILVEKPPPKVENEPRRLGAAVSLSAALGSGRVPLSDSSLVSEVSVATLRPYSK